LPSDEAVKLSAFFVILPYAVLVDPAIQQRLTTPHGSAT